MIPFKRCFWPYCNSFINHEAAWILLKIPRFCWIRWGMQLDPLLTWSTDLSRRLDRCIRPRNHSRPTWSTSNLLLEVILTCRSVCIFLNIKSGSTWSTSNLIRGFILTSRSVHFSQRQVILGVDQVAFLVIKRSIVEICIGTPYFRWKQQDFDKNKIFSSRYFFLGSNPSIHLPWHMRLWPP